ncbi:MAG: O-antigen ligase family protein [Cyclobacteriaceae bacterium]|nr:O-antigen ligase family protein [Cyclobacteriaceae bacterium]
MRSQVGLYFVLVVGSLLLVAGLSLFGLEFGFIFIAAVVGIPILGYSIVNLRFGILTLLCYSYFLGLSRYLPDIPMGVAMDVMLGVMLLGLLISKWSSRDYATASNAISVVVWIWIIYNVFEFLNPMASRQVWIYVIRGIALLMMFYFIVLQATNSLQFIKKLIHVWLGLTLVAAVYGLFQEFHGLTEAEKAWVAEDEFRFDLIFNWGRYRIFSFFSDPTIFGILMAYTGLFCVAMMAGPFKFGYKIILGLLACIFLLAMVYAGTRTAFAMVPAGLLFFALLTLQRRTLMICGVLGAIGAGIIFSDIRNVGPFLSTSNLERIRSAFKPGEDASFQVRERSQAFIKPFIQSHPFGAGLGSIGIWARRFTPDSPLSKFAPDSGYVRVAVELGWFGLLIYCVFFAAILITGIRNYYRMHDPELKAYLAAILSAIFAIVIANYPQEALIQAPTILIFYFLMAFIVKLKKFDEQKQHENP